MTANQFRFVALTLFAVINVVVAWSWVPPSSGRGDVLLVSLLCAPTVVLAWWWNERLARPQGERRTLGDFFAMPKVQAWSALGLLIVVGFAAWRLWTAPDAPRDLLLITVPLPFLAALLTWWVGSITGMRSVAGIQWNRPRHNASRASALPCASHSCHDHEKVVS